MTLAHTPTDRRRIATVVATALALVAAAVAWTGATAPGATVAFEQTWSAPSCTAVDNTAGQRGFFDDAPGAGGNNESAFFWANANDSGNEYCRVVSAVNLSSGVYKNASMRAAVNDNTTLIVAFYSGSNCSETKLGQLTISGADANSQFRDRGTTLTGGTIRSVCVWIDDATDAHAQRISALVDFIRLADLSGAIGWQERFTRGG